MAGVPVPAKYRGDPLQGVEMLFYAFLLAVMIVTGSCTPNDPYRSAERNKNIFYSTFNEPPKHLDPAKAYSSDEYELIGQIYEPAIQYHYLIRPYTLVPLTARAVPAPVYLDKNGRGLPDGVLPEKVYRAVYEIRIKKGIMYQPHPAFAKEADGSPLYKNLTPKDLEGIDDINDFPVKAARELKSDDYILEVMRLADPAIESPVFAMLEKYILGLHEYSEALRADLEAARRQRRENAGPAYNRTVDEKERPIVLDYKKHPLPGVEKVDDYTYRIILKAKYPQFIYWLAMPFFAPMPEEAVRFYSEDALKDRNITLNRFPVGTGPYMMDRYNPNMEIVLGRNKNFHREDYPDKGEAGDDEKGLLEDAGRPLPFMDMIVFKQEKEAIPRWNKFLQGYYDNSGITSESFDTAVTVSAAGRAELTAQMTQKGIRLLTSVRPSVYYTGFNMTDDTVGGLSIEKQKLRQAISIALDDEEYIEIFNNGRGVPAMSILPPGIFGYVEGADGINPYVYKWDSARKKPVRRDIEYAGKLMAEAGFPGGRTKDGSPLVITFDNPWTGADMTPVINWYIKRFRLLGIQLENKTTDYNRFQEKMTKGNFQFFSWGWNADYPDPENFYFLLSTANGKVKYQGENASNYSNPEFDRLFKMMENMNNSPERLRLIKEMTHITRQDAPLVWGFYPVAFGLSHAWVRNVKSNAMANNTMKYIRLDVAKRRAARDEWNRPILWPIAAAAALLVIAAIPAIIAVRKRMRGGRG
ncbi:MAG: ABC transporter substrate-binding protein [Deltaproteobacteria bacterium]|nr:ABC transporter substrate-binding protein [Deltaproteobacteria bacterium]